MPPRLLMHFCSDRFSYKVTIWSRYLTHHINGMAVMINTDKEFKRRNRAVFFIQKSKKAIKIYCNFDYNTKKQQAFKDLPEPGSIITPQKPSFKFILHIFGSLVDTDWVFARLAVALYYLRSTAPLVSSVSMIISLQDCFLRTHISLNVRLH